MSHMIRAKTKLTDQTILMSACERLGLSFHAQEEHIILGNGTVVLEQQKDGTFIISGDPYYDNSLRKYYNKTSQFIADLQTQYNIIQTDERLTELGYIWTENQEAEVGEDGNIRLVFQSVGG